jgi:hypothetical protein
MVPELVQLRECLKEGNYGMAVTFLDFIECDEDIRLPQPLMDAIYCNAADYWMQTLSSYSDLAIRHHMVISAGKCLSKVSADPELTVLQKVKEEYERNCDIVYGEKVKDSQDRALIDTEFYAMRNNFRTAAEIATRAGLLELAFVLGEEAEQAESWAKKYGIFESDEAFMDRQVKGPDQKKALPKEGWNPDAPFEDIDEACEPDKRESKPDEKHPELHMSQSKDGPWEDIDDWGKPERKGKKPENAKESETDYADGFALLFEEKE